MKKTSSLLLCFSLILLFSCSGGFFSRKDDAAKPYYFSTHKHKPAFHASKPVTAKTIPDSVANKKEYTITSKNSSSDFAAEENKKADSNSAAKKARSEKPLQNSVSSESQKHAREKVKLTQQKKTDNWFLAAAALFSVLTASVFGLFIPRAKSLASWAKENKKAARFTIAAGHLLIGFGGYFIGRKLADYGVATTEVSTFSLLGFAGIAALAYPDKNQNGLLKYTFRRNKILSFLVLLSGFLLFLNIGNREVTDNDFNPTTKQISEAAGSNLYADWQEKITQHNEPNSPLQVNDAIASLMFLLLVIFFLAFLWGIAFISCSLACSNQGTAAAFVIIGGIGLGIYLLIIFMREIERGAKRREEKRQPKPPKKPFKEKYKWF